MCREFSTVSEGHQVEFLSPALPSETVRNSAVERVPEINPALVAGASLLTLRNEPPGVVPILRAYSSLQTTAILSLHPRTVDYMV